MRPRRLDLRSSPAASKLWFDHMAGDVSASSVQKSAASQVAEYGPAASESIKALAAIGNHGKTPQHLERDLQRLRLDDDSICATPDPYMIDLTIRCPDRLGVRTVKRPIILPHAPRPDSPAFQSSRFSRPRSHRAHALALLFVPFVRYSCLRPDGG